MSYDIKGTVKLVGDTQDISDKFRKRELVLTVEDGNYPQEVSLEFQQNNADKLDNIEEGAEAEVTFDIKGREYNGRYYNTLVGWKIKSEPASGPVDEEEAPF